MSLAAARGAARDKKVVIFAPVVNAEGAFFLRRVATDPDALLSSLDGCGVTAVPRFPEFGC